MAMLQSITALSSAQLMVLRRAYEYGVYGVKEKVTTQNLNYRTEVILREGGFIEKGYDIRDEDERVDIQQAQEVEVKSAEECIGRNWKAAYEHLKAAVHLDIKLNKTAYWLTEKGRYAVERVK